MLNMGGGGGLQCIAVVHTGRPFIRVKYKVASKITAVIIVFLLFNM